MSKNTDVWLDWFIHGPCSISYVWIFTGCIFAVFLLYRWICPSKISPLDSNLWTLHHGLSSRKLEELPNRTGCLHQFRPKDFGRWNLTWNTTKRWTQIPPKCSQECKKTTERNCRNDIKTKPVPFLLWSCLMTWCTIEMYGHGWHVFGRTGCQNMLSRHIPKSLPEYIHWLWNNTWRSSQSLTYINPKMQPYRPGSINSLDWA